MKTHLNILEDVLEKNGNDVELAKVILSFLHSCKECKNYCINTKIYYIEDCNTRDWRIKCLCFECMREVMLNHNHGKRGVLTYQEHQDHIHKIRWVKDYGVFYESL